jgi:hypothetical protein
VSSEDGLVLCLDTRTGGGSKPVFQLLAHEKPTTALSLCPGRGVIEHNVSTNVGWTIDRTGIWVNAHRSVGQHEPCLRFCIAPTLKVYVMLRSPFERCSQ